MPWNAIEALHDARESTQSLLWPLETGRWLRLALIVLFVGGAGGGVPAGNTGGNVDGGPTDAPSTDAPPTLPIDGGIDLSDLVLSNTAAAAALVVLALVVLLVLAWAVIGPVMEFVLVEGLRTRDVRVRRPFRRYLGAGLRLFAFRLALLLAAVSVVALPVAALVLAGLTLGPAVLLLLIPLLVLFFGVFLVFSVAMRLTTDFVVPAMIAEDRGVIDGWRRVLPLVRAEWREFGLYLVLRYVLGIAAGVAVGLVLGLLSLLVALPFVLVGAGIFFALTAGSGALGAVGVAGLAVLVGLALVWLLCTVVVGLFVQVPVVTYFRYYALQFLGREDADLDLLAGIRDAGETTE